MGLFSKKADFITAGQIPDGYEIIDVVLGTSNYNAAFTRSKVEIRKGIMEAKKELLDEAHKLGGTAVANLHISYNNDEGYKTVLVYGDAIKKI
ncbi:hypothetical protein [Lactiplantibacillus paraxiangfangensis]|uniref:hypothetical protein n=1 Tax=Lactiplantibacillus paraxiangfangensis TaxID=3076224 RepID=UPI0030C7155D